MFSYFTNDLAINLHQICTRRNPNLLRAIEFLSQVDLLRAIELILSLQKSIAERCFRAKDMITILSIETEFCNFNTITLVNSNLKVTE